MDEAGQDIFTGFWEHSGHAGLSTIFKDRWDGSKIGVVIFSPEGGEFEWIKDRWRAGRLFYIGAKKQSYPGKIGLTGGDLVVWMVVFIDRGGV